jgi:hypothetical protein
MKHVTIKDIARSLCISVSTVSRALTDDKNIRKETREMVVEEAKRLGYKRNPVAMNLKMGRTNTIGVIVPEMHTPYASQVINGIQEVLYKKNQKVMIAESDEKPERELENLKMMEQFMVDGLIVSLCSYRKNIEMYQQLAADGMAIVFYDRIPYGLKMPQVVVDDNVDSYFMVEHLIRLGKKRYVIPYDYPDMDSSLMHIYLLEAGDRLLAGMSQDSSKKAYEFLTSMGVDVQFGKMVTDYKDHKVLMKDGEEIPTRTFLWVSGVKAQPITGIDGDHLGRGFRIVVDEFNRIPGMDGLFAIGDQCIQTADPAYPGGHPQLAQVAIQQAALLAKNIQKIAEGATDSQLKPFRYKNLGSMATIGRNKAVVELGKFHSQGFFAWVLWLVVHLRSILGVKNKVMVMLNWLWKYVSYNDSIRMITYATKPKEVRDRLKREQTTHLGTDLLENEEEEEEA